MKIVPCAFQLPNGELLTVRSLCADDAEALNAFRLATYRETHFMARYPEEGANLETLQKGLAGSEVSALNFEVGAFAGEKLVGEFGVAQVRPHRPAPTVSNSWNWGCTAITPVLSISMRNLALRAAASSPVPSNSRMEPTATRS